MQEKETFISEFKRVDQIRFGDEIKEKIVTERYSARLIKYGVDEKVRVTERERERKKKKEKERERDRKREREKVRQRERERQIPWPGDPHHKSVSSSVLPLVDFAGKRETKIKREQEIEKEIE